MGTSLSKESQLVLKAASKGDADLVHVHLAEHPRLLKSVTLLKRSGLLHIAAREGHVDVLEAVLGPLIEPVREEIQADRYPGPASRRLRKVVNSRDLYYRTPLLLAAKKGHMACVRCLVESAGNLFAVDREANTCLHYAALMGHGEVVEYLLARTNARGITARFINKRNLSGFTPLHYAVWGSQRSVAHQLLLNGADSSFSNDRVFDNWVPVPIGSTPLHLAVMRNSWEMVWLLLEHYAGQTLAAAPDEPAPPDPRQLVNLYGMNAAQLAAHMGRRRMARALLPQLPVTRLFDAIDLMALRQRGLPLLQAIAASALQRALWAQLDGLEAAQRRLNQRRRKARLAGVRHSAQLPAAPHGAGAAGDAAAAAAGDTASAGDQGAAVQYLGGGATEFMGTAAGSAVSAVGAPSRMGWLQALAVVSWPRHRPAAGRYPEVEAAAARGAGGGAAHGGDSCGGGHCGCGSPACRCGTDGGGGAAAVPTGSKRGARRGGSAAAAGHGCCGDGHAGGGADADADAKLDNVGGPNGYGDTADEDTTCSVCLEGTPNTAITGCLHTLCAGCARRVTEIKTLRPPRCPFCRGLIRGFQLAAEPPAAHMA